MEVSSLQNDPSITPFSAFFPFQEEVGAGLKISSF